MPGAERGLALARTTLDGDGGGRRPRPGRRRIPPLQHRRALARCRTSRRCSTTTRCSRRRTRALFARTKEPRFARAARRTLEWVEREIARPGGGYASSLDADTQGHEGAHLHVDRAPRCARSLPTADADFVVEVLGIRPEGNYDEEATGRATGRNIPHFAAPLARARGGAGPRPRGAARRGSTRCSLALRACPRRARAAGSRRQGDRRLERAAALGLRARGRGARRRDVPRVGPRARRVPPARAPPRGRHAAPIPARPPGRRSPGSPRTWCTSPRGSSTSPRPTRRAAAGREAARAVADDLLARFEDREVGGFWATASGTHETLIARAKEVCDSPIPSDNGTAARLLLRLAARTGEARYRAAADRTLAAYRPLLARAETGRGVVALVARARPADGARPRRAPRRGPGPGRRARAPGRRRGGRAGSSAARPGRGRSVRLAVRVRLDEGWHVNGADAPAGRVGHDARARGEGAGEPGLRPAGPRPSPVASGAPARLRRARSGSAARSTCPRRRRAGPRRVSLLLTRPAVRRDLVPRARGGAPRRRAALRGRRCPGAAPGRLREVAPAPRRALRSTSRRGEGRRGSAMIEVTTRTLGGFKVEARARRPRCDSTRPRRTAARARAPRRSETLLAALSACAATDDDVVREAQAVAARERDRDQATLERPAAGGDGAPEDRPDVHPRGRARRRAEEAPPSRSPANARSTARSRARSRWRSGSREPRRARLEVFDNPRARARLRDRARAPRVHVALPAHGQPDFATVTVRYVPDRTCVELKSLKHVPPRLPPAGRVLRGAGQPDPRRPRRGALAPRRIEVEGEFRGRGRHHLDGDARATRTRAAGGGDVSAKARRIPRGADAQSSSSACAQELARQQKIGEAAYALHTSLDLDDLLGLILKAAREGVDADRGTVYLLSADGQRALVARALGHRPSSRSACPWGAASPAPSRRTARRSGSTTSTRTRASTAPGTRRPVTGRGPCSPRPSATASARSSASSS